MVAVHPHIDTVLTTTRTVRLRLDLERPVERQLVEECLDLALQAPSGGDRQDWRFLGVDDPATISQVGGIYRQAFFAHYGDPESAAAGQGLSAPVAASAYHLARHLDHAPMLVVPYRTGVSAPSERAGQASFWASILPVTWSFMLAARSRGLVTAYTARGLDRESELAAALGIGYPDETQAGVVVVAHPDNQRFGAGRRRPLSEVLRWLP